MSAASAAGQQRSFCPRRAAALQQRLEIIMPMNRILGLVLLVVGAILLVFAYRASNAPVDQISNALTGRFTDQTMWFVILGGIGVVAGGLLAAFGSRR
jgi:drug/metabolite transporter (DMT)-like permease